MITYNYSARQLATGVLVKAEVQAESESAAAKLLMDQMLFPISIEQKSENKGALSFLNRIKPKDRVIFTRQLATLINAGLPLTQSLRTVRDQLSSKPLQVVVDSIVASVEGGVSLSKAFSEHPKVFNSIYVSLISAGEATGTLDTSLERIAFQQEKDAAIASKIRGALTYPAVVLVVILGVSIFMVTGVLPQITKLFADLHKTLPFFTQLLDKLSQFLIHQWWLAILIAGAAIFGMLSYFKTPSGKSNLDTIKMKIPVFGPIFMKVYMARFARTLGTMMSSGIPMIQGLEIVRDGIGNVHVAKTIDDAIQKVKAGKSLSSALEGKETFLSLVPQMVLIGEQSGAIDQLLERVAKYYEDEVDETVKNLSSIIEPLMMVVMGVLVGGLIAAILVPVYGLVGAGDSFNK